MIEGRNLIGGRWSKAVDVGAGLAVENPATEQVIGRIPVSSDRTVDAAIAAASDALPRWRDTPLPKRAELISAGLTLLAERRELVDLAVDDTGHPHRLASALHLDGAVQTGREMIEQALKIQPEALDRGGGSGLSRVFHEPYGVVGVLTPFNGPLSLSIWKAIPALVTGNTIVAKPSEVAPLLVEWLYAALLEAGMPPGVANLVHGGPETASYLAGHHGLDKITFTGSTRVGRLVGAAAAQGLTPCVLELGGKSPAVVLPDADLQAAAQTIAASVFLASGQTCTALSRVLVQRSRRDELQERIAEVASQLRVGDPRDDLTDIGPLASGRQAAHVDDLVKTAQAEGARVIIGGGRTWVDDSGHYYLPTVLTDVDNRSTIASTEVFGPVVSVTGYSAIDEAVRMANDSDFGLAASVFGDDPAQAQAVAARIDAGTVWVNDANVFRSDAPFGGMRHSGNGRELGMQGLLEFTQTKHLHEASVK